MRPQKERDIKEPPRIQSFKPAGIPRRILERITLSIDEFEAIRLADYEGLDHSQASEKMGISRPTFTRLIERARSKTAAALIDVAELFIEGGNVHFRNNIFRCGKCGHILRLDTGNNGPRKCPECGALNMADLASQFGHGECCGSRGGREDDE